MSGRVLLAIGCDTYEHLGPLGCAEADATALFDLLVDPKVGDYDSERSRLMVSPTLQEVRVALAAILFDGPQLDTLTLTFAGHGVVSSGSFYMGLCDSRLDALSATALPLADLFRMIAEAAPRQTYLILDACQSGGLIADLNVILKSEVIGELDTPGITLLATSASNEDAGERDGHGIGTAALIDCIRGDIFIQDDNSALDLVEIGRAVSERIGPMELQTPVVWGLNLYGPPGFCKNPHAGLDEAPLRTVLSGWPDARTAAMIREGLPGLWQPLVAIPTDWEPREFLDRLAALLEPFAHEPDIFINLWRRVSDAAALRARQSDDRFREIEVHAACAVALLRYCDLQQAKEAMSDASTEIADLALLATQDAIATIEHYRLALVTGGLADLFYLPLRLSRLMGWAGFALHCRQKMGLEVEDAAQSLSALLERIFETYSLSLVAMSDSQAPHILSALTACKSAGFEDAGEQVLGHMFASSIDCRGEVARVDLDPSKVLQYLIARHARSEQPVELLAQPSELILVLLRLARLFDLEDEFDGSLEALDHVQINAFLAADYREFGDALIEHGTNTVSVIGHDFWRIAELEAVWPQREPPTDPETAMTALMASLLFPDRSPWFLLPATPACGNHN